MARLEVTTSANRRKVLANSANTVNERERPDEANSLVEQAGEAVTLTSDVAMRELLASVLEELRITNAHLAAITDEKFTCNDID